MNNFDFKPSDGKAYICSQNAFTLAEVLITLGIIGIVAALTIPAFMSKYQEKVYESLQKKNKNIVQNGLRLMMAKTETFKVPNLPIMTSCSSFYDSTCMSKEMKKYFQVVNDTEGGFKADVLPEIYSTSKGNEESLFRWTDPRYIFTTPDGMVYGLVLDDDEMTFSVISDTNGTKRPNTVKKDLYKYRLGGSGTISDVSFELDEILKCSIDKPEDCKTQEACMMAVNVTVTESGYSSGYAFNSNHRCMHISWGDWDGGVCYGTGVEDYYCSN